MKYSTLILTLLMFCITGRSQVASGREDRAYWISILSQVSDPLLNNMSKGELRKNMPVETVSGAANPSNARTTHLEALGRLLVGIAPWLELGPDETSEGQLREKYIQLMLKSIEYGFDPESPDYLNFTVTRQPLVDAAFFCQGVLRAPVQVWSRLSPVVRQNVLNALQQIRNIKPVESNWLLFSAMVEAALLELTGECNMYPIEYAVMRFKEWYKGDAWYGDGVNLHMDYYNSFVIHPMLTDVLVVMKKHNIEGADFLDTQLKRHARYAEILERFISPEGSFPVVGRSICYRFGVFHALGQAALMHILPERVKPAQVRCALTSVIRRQLKSPANFDKNGWLRVGFTGEQIEISESYINTGSVYLCAFGLVPLGLPETDEFWSAPYTEWTNVKAWNGEKVQADHAIK